MQRSPLLRLAAGIAFASAMLPVPAHADQFPLLPSAAAVVDDNSLASIRGMYVPATEIRVPASASLAPAGARGAADPFAYRGASAAASPLAGVSGGNAPIVYFGVTMTSSWSVASSGVVQSVQVGASINIDVQHRTVSVGTWSGSQNGGLPAGAPTGNAVDGAPPVSNISSGVGQSIQVAGNGNVITNHATVAYGPGPAAAAIAPNSNACGGACSFHADSGGVGISISTAQGVVSQNIGPSGIVQSAQVWSDLNHISNQLGVNIQTGSTHASTLPSLPNATQIAPILPSIAGIP